MTNYSENELVFPALEIINKHKDGIKTSVLIQELREKIKPSWWDLNILEWRKDDKFSQKVRNLKSHNSLERKWYIIYKNDKFYITTNWVSYIKQNDTRKHLDKDQDIRKFNFILSKINDFKEIHDTRNITNAFYIYILENFFWDNDFEITDNITDTSFFKEKMMNDKKWWRDHGIDAILVTNTNNKYVYKIFNFKSTESFQTAQKTFKWSEIDKIYAFINRIKIQDKTILTEDLNENLKNFVMEIFEKLDNFKYDVIFEVILVSNYYNWLNEEDSKRFRNMFPAEKLTEITLNEILEDELNDYNKINAKIRFDSKDFIELNEWWVIRSIILKVDAQELIRICINNSEIRNNIILDDFSILKDFELERLVFEENVRIHLNENKRNQINNNIMKTALSLEDRSKFFYFNNWVTIVCDEYSCPDNKINPKSPSTSWKSNLNLSQIQIVNWQQTIYSLFEALKENNDWFSDVKVLCKVYEVKDKKIRAEVAKYTNSQNAIKTRDLKSIDDIQDIIQRELKAKYDILYERKKNEFHNIKDKEKIDSEKAGQIILSFFLEDPTKAKNKKSSIFWDEYEKIFWWEYWYNEIYLWNELFKHIEKKKQIVVKTLNKNLKEWIINNKNYEKESYIKHCSLFILFIIKKLIDKDWLEVNSKNIEKIKEKYDNAIEIIEKMIKSEFFDKKWESKKFLLYWPFFKNKPSIDRFNEIFYK